MENATARRYSRIAKFYDLFQGPLELFSLRRLRRRTVSAAEGKILEVGIGTGANLPFYPPSADLTGIDFSRGMLEIARGKTRRLGMENTRLIEMNVEALEFDDDTFDTTLSTFVFCTVPDPDKGLRELYRVLKPGGKAIFLEHMKSELGWINLFLRIMDKVSTPMLGTSMVRETQKGIEKAGFTILSVDNELFDVLRLIVATKKGG